MQCFAKKYGKHITGFSASARHRMMTYTWPGNVRELQHVVERAVILSDGAVVSEYVLFDRGRTWKPKEVHVHSLNLQEMEHFLIAKAMKQSGNNLSYASRLLGISRYTLYRKIAANKKAEQHDQSME